MYICHELEYSKMLINITCEQIQFYGCPNELLLLKKTKKKKENCVKAKTVWRQSTWSRNYLSLAVEMTKLRKHSSQSERLILTDSDCSRYAAFPGI